MRFAVLLSMLFALPAAAAETILVLPIQEHGRVDNAALHKIEQELERGLTERGTSVVGARSTPDSAVHKCKEKPTCLGALGQKAKAQKVLSGRATADGKAFSVQFVLIASDSGAQIQTTSLSFAAGADVGKVVAEGLSRIVPVEESDMPALQAVSPIKKKKSDPRMIEAAPADSGPELAAPMRVSSGPRGRSRSMLYTGIALGALGAIGLGTGVTFGVMSTATAATDHPGETRQVPSLAIEQRANQQVVIANVGIGVGAGLLAVGVVLIITDIVMQKRSQTSVSARASGTSLGVAF